MFVEKDYWSDNTITGGECLHPGHHFEEVQQAGYCFGRSRAALFALETTESDAVLVVQLQASLEGVSS